MTTTQHDPARLFRHVLHVLASHPQTRHGHGVPLWSVVARLIGTGSTTAAEVCRQFGQDPDALVLEPEWVDTSTHVVVECCPVCEALT